MVSNTFAQECKQCKFMALTSAEDLTHTVVCY